MAAKNVVITGANSGIGYESALHFAAKGDHVIMACRSLDKAEKAQQQILEKAPAANITIIKLDVSNLESVAEFSRLFAEQVGSLDILINNAGIVAIPLSRNSAGHEMQLATNYLGAFSLTGLLLPLFPADTPARIINVASLAHRFGKLNMDNFNWENNDYDQWKAYANSKVATMSHTLELNRRLQESGRSNIIALGAHPGFANTNIQSNNTNIQSNSPTLTKTTPISIWFQKQTAKLIPTAADAARPIILAAEGENSQGGDYYGPTGFLEIGGKPGKARLNPLAKDIVLGKALWTKSESMTGTSYLSDV